MDGWVWRECRKGGVQIELSVRAKKSCRGEERRERGGEGEREKKNFFQFKSSQLNLMQINSVLLDHSLL